MKATRVVAASPPVQPEVGQNRPPRMDRAVPPVEGPKLGSQKLTNGPAPAAAGWNWIVMVAVPVSPPEVEVARTTAVPGNSEQRRSEEHTSELQSQSNLVCRLLLEKKN